MPSTVNLAPSGQYLTLEIRTPTDANNRTLRLTHVKPPRKIEKGLDSFPALTEIAKISCRVVKLTRSDFSTCSAVPLTLLQAAQPWRLWRRLEIQRYQASFQVEVSPAGQLNSPRLFTSGEHMIQRSMQIHPSFFRVPLDVLIRLAVSLIFDSDQLRQHGCGEFSHNLV